MDRLILNIDPDATARASISRILREHRYDVHEADGIDQVLGSAAARAPFAIIVAPHVNGRAGDEVCRQWASSGSGYTILRIHGEPSSDAADAFVSEPVQPVVLKAAIRALEAQAAMRTENASLKRELQECRDELHLCISRATHDLSEPVRAFSTFIDLIRQEGVDRLSNSEIRYLERVEEATDRARSLLKYLTSYVQAGREPTTSHRNVDLRGVVLAVEAQQAEEIQKAGATIRVEDLPTVKGNPARLQQLISGLLSNSLKYRNPDKPLHIVIQAAEDVDNRWVISVADNGVGMDSQHHEAIFAPFHRLHGRDVPGTGMGLALARRIVEAHGGTMQVKSAPGQGATFFFSLPGAD